MKKTLIIALLIACILFLQIAGFKYIWREDSNIGVVDLERAANAVGWTEEIRHSLQQMRTASQGQMDTHLRPLREALDKKWSEITKAKGLDSRQADELKKAAHPADLEKLGLSKTQIDDLVKALERYSMESNAAQMQLNQSIQSYQQSVMLACSRAAEPAIRRVASAYHRSVILTPAGNLLYSDPAADMTDKVIDDLQHSTIKLVLPEPPRLDLAPLKPAASTQP